MKKLVLSTIAVAAMAGVTAFGQGYMYIDGSNNTNPSSTATSSGLVFINGALDTGTDINFILLGGSSAGNLSTLATLLLSQATTTGTSGGTALTEPASGDITGVGTGVIYDLSGDEYNVPNLASGSGFFEVEAWTGAFNTLAAAQTGGANWVVSSIFNETVLVGNQNEGANQGDLESMPALNLTSTPVPEPATLAFAGLGGLSLLLFRRRA